MSLIDRYIVKSYLLNVVVLLLIVFCFIVTVDVSLNLNRFGKAATAALAQESAAISLQSDSDANAADDANNADSAMNTQDTQTPSGLAHVTKVVSLVADLWWPRLLMLFNFLIGLVMVGAMGFTCAQMVRHSEFVAILASGQSLHRVWKPILLVSLGLIAMQVANHQWVLPRIAPLLTRDTGDAGKHDLDAAHVPMTVDGNNRVFSAALFDPSRETLADVTIYERTDDGRAIRTIHADSAQWNGNAWVLDHPHVTIHDRAVIGLTSPGYIETNLSPDELKRLRFASFSRNLSWSQIGAIIRRNRSQADQRSRMGDTIAAARFDERAGDLERVRFGRVSVMASSMLTIVICLPLFVTRLPLNMAIQSLKCAPIAMVALMGAMLGAEAPIPGLAPQIAVFLPVLLLAPIAVLVSTSVRT